MNTSSKLRGENDRFLILGTDILKWKQIHSGEYLIHFSHKYSRFGNKHHDGLWIGFNRETLRIIPVLFLKNRFLIFFIWDSLDLGCEY